MRSILKDRIEETLLYYTDLLTLIKKIQELEILKSITLDIKRKRNFYSKVSKAFNKKIGNSLIYSLINSNIQTPQEFIAKDDLEKKNKKNNNNLK